MRKVFGDILSYPDSDKEVIVCHQVNCRGVMGAGLALQIRMAFPDVFENYRRLCFLADKPHKMLGFVQFVPAIHHSESGDVTYFNVANVFSQNGYGVNGRYTDYDAMRAAFTRIAEQYPNATVRIPYRMGCGLGGGNWEIVEDIIRKTLEDRGIDVEIWVYAG